MAVEDKYVNADDVAGDKVSSDFGLSRVANRIATEETAAADDNLSVYRFFKAVPVDSVITNLPLLNDVITGGTDFNIGVYETDLGAVIDDNLLADALDLSSASTGFGQNGLANVDVANRGLSLRDLINTVVGAGTVTFPTVDIALNSVVQGSGVGTVTMIMDTK